jgi:hypothetical protein
LGESRPTELQCASAVDPKPLAVIKPKPDRPPDKKRRPGSTGIERGSKKNSKAVSHKTSTEQPRSRQEPDREISVYDGRTRQAGITVTGDEFVVIMADGRQLDIGFKTLAAARAAISAESRAPSDTVGNTRDNINSHDGSAR